MRWRYFGARPLVEDGSVSSSPTSIFNARLGYVFDNGLKLQVDGFNIFNTQASQIDYYYQSQLRSEAAPVNDMTLPPGRAARLPLHHCEGFLAPLESPNCIQACQLSCVEQNLLSVVLKSRGVTSALQRRTSRQPLGPCLIIR